MIRAQEVDRHGAAVPALGVGLTDRFASTLGAVASYLMLVDPDPVLPALSVQLPEMAILPPSGPL